VRAFGAIEGRIPLRSIQGNDVPQMPHRGFQATSFPRAVFAMAFAVSIAYYGRFLPTAPVSDGTPKKCGRNAEIRARHQQGESVATLADVFGISEQRVSQILRGQRK
jgi:hypothetical protein